MCSTTATDVFLRVAAFSVCVSRCASSGVRRSVCVFWCASSGVRRWCASSGVRLRQCSDRVPYIGCLLQALQGNAALQDAAKCCKRMQRCSSAARGCKRSAAGCCKVCEKDRNRAIFNFRTPVSRLKSLERQLLSHAFLSIGDTRRRTK